MNKEINVAFSGSGFLFPAHAGALWELLKRGYEVKTVAGTSGGAFIAALYAATLDPEVLVDVSMADFSSALQINWLSAFRFIFRKHLSSRKSFRKLLTDRFKNRKMVDVKIPLLVMATDFLDATPHVFSSLTTPLVPMVDVLLASASLPIVFSPMRIGSGSYLDGGMCDNDPVDLLRGSARTNVLIRIESNYNPQLHYGKLGLAATIKMILDRTLSSFTAEELKLDSEVMPYIQIPIRYSQGALSPPSLWARKALFDAGKQAIANSVFGMPPTL
jgi:NTE family protein